MADVFQPAHGNVVGSSAWPPPSKERLGPSTPGSHSAKSTLTKANIRTHHRKTSSSSSPAAAAHINLNKNKRGHPGAGIAGGRMDRRRSRPQLRQDQPALYGSPEKQMKPPPATRLRRHGRSFSDVMSEISGKIRACRRRTSSDDLASPLAALALEREQQQQQMVRFADVDPQHHMMPAPMQHDPGCTHYGTDGIVYHVDLTTHTMTPVGYHAQNHTYHAPPPSHYDHYGAQLAQTDAMLHYYPGVDQPCLEPAYIPDAADQHPEQEGDSDTSMDALLSGPATDTPPRSESRRRELRKRGGRGKGNTRQRTNSWVQEERKVVAVKERQRHVVDLLRHAEEREKRQAPWSAQDEPVLVEGACEIQGTIFFPIRKHAASHQQQKEEEEEEGHHHHHHQEATPSPGTPPAAPPAASAYKAASPAQPLREQGLTEKMSGVRGGLFSSLMTNESYDWSRHGALSEGESVDSSVEIIIHAI